MARKYRPKNRYYRGSKLTEQQFAQIVLFFTQGSPASEIAAVTGVSLRSINDLLIKLRKRVFEDITLDPLRQVHGDYYRLPADHPGWQQHSACLYDCPTLRMDSYPEPVAKSVSTPWHPADYKELCGHCGVLLHRRHPFWVPLELWSRINYGLPKETYAYHVVYLMLVGHTQVTAPVDWQKIILQALARQPL